MHKSTKPSHTEMVAIRDKDYNIYNYPTYEHYNWCLDYLEDCRWDRVVDPHILLSKEAFYQVQQTMIEACTKYLTTDTGE